MPQPNHICKNINCNKGEDGKPKHYYACDYCDRSRQWKSMACCIECYDEYMKQIVEARSKNKKIDTSPNRTDKTKDEVQKLMNKPLDEVLKETKEELKDYIKDDVSISKAIEQINTEIEETNNNKKKSQRKSKSRKQEG